ncbi:MAG TPA: hydrogenase maturation protease [Candidatus Limnocylindria bacterium]|jgi:hydrogenase maturation protease
MRRVTLLACGDPMRGDDAVAATVVEALPASTLALVQVRQVGQIMPDDLLDTDGPLILVDAVKGPAPGEVIDLPLASLLDGQSSGIIPASTHALPLPITLAIAERLGGELQEGRFIGVAGGGYEIGAALSPAVREAVLPCAARLDHWIRVLAHESRTGACV